MSYLDTTLTPASGYTYVNSKQIYDAIAARLGAHAAWSLVDTVDYVVTTVTSRRYVWKCSASVSGLLKDFHVVFEARFTTATGLWETVNGTGFVTYLGEDYDVATKTLSKYAVVGNMTAAYTLNSDRTHPGVWVLTAIRPALTNNVIAWTQTLTTTGRTSLRLLIGVTNDGIFFAEGSSAYLTYVGAMETLLAPTDDPLALIIYSNNTNGAPSTSAGHAFTTRHPMIPVASSTYTHGMTVDVTYQSTSSGSLSGAPYTPLSGTIGAPTSTTWNLFFAGALVAKACLSMFGNSSNSASTKGGLRGFFKNLLSALMPAHQFGDTFQINGKTYVGIGTQVYGTWDTSA